MHVNDKSSAALLGVIEKPAIAGFMIIASLIGQKN